MATIRRATQGDCTAISCILRECYRWFEDNIGMPAETVTALIAQRSSTEYVSKLLAKNLWLAAEADGIVACAAGIEANELSMLYVDPAYHRRGIGRMLFGAAETAIADAGYDKMFLRTGASPSVPFYEAMGMVRTGDKLVEIGPCKGMALDIYTKRLLSTT